MERLLQIIIINGLKARKRSTIKLLKSLEIFKPSNDSQLLYRRILIPKSLSPMQETRRSDEMKPEDQRIAIAEACGWKEVVRTIDSRKELTGITPNKMRVMHKGVYRDHISDVPDYLNDLNAMHEAEKVLTNYQRVMMIKELYKMFEFEEDAYHRDFDATASQRSEAFLRTLGLWKESDK